MSQLGRIYIKYFKSNHLKLVDACCYNGQIKLFTKAVIFRIVVVFFSVVSFFSCDKSQNHVIPSVPFSFTVNLNIVNDLTVPGNSVFFPNAGYGGVIIYCELPGSYYAFDATCTNEVSRSCILENESILATCPCCGSEFVLLSGAYPSKGPATMPLRPYNISIVNDFTLRVYN
jgi:nitrite reductase/ring-hydroxylating ferredoxin subunit